MEDRYISIHLCSFSSVVEHHTCNVKAACSSHAGSYCVNENHPGWLSFIIHSTTCFSPCVAAECPASRSCSEAVIRPSLPGQILQSTRCLRISILNRYREVRKTHRCRAA